MTSAHVLWVSARGTVGGHGACSRAQEGRAMRLPTAVNGRGARPAPLKRGARGGAATGGAKGRGALPGSAVHRPQTAPGRGVRGSVTRCSAPPRASRSGRASSVPQRERGLRCGGSGGRRRDGAPYISEECPCPAP